MRRHEGRAEVGGYPALWHDLNVGADGIATGASGQHTDDFGTEAVRQYQFQQRVRRHWRYFLAIYKIARGLSQRRGQAGLTARQKLWDRSTSRERSIPMTHGTGSTGS